MCLAAGLCGGLEQPPRWFDFWTNEILDGGREIDRPVDLETMPLHVRAGAILPAGPVRQYVDEPVSGPLTVTVYPGDDGSFAMYEDDGRTFEYRKGAWMKLAMTWTEGTRRLTLRLAEGSRMLPPMKRPLDLRVAGAQSSRQVVFTGSPLELEL